ncbi:hypothetical protein NKG05_23715 [Oerskovia sp. M15]
MTSGTEESSGDASTRGRGRPARRAPSALRLRVGRTRTSGSAWPTSAPPWPGCVRVSGWSRVVWP